MINLRERIRLITKSSIIIQDLAYEMRSSVLKQNIIFSKDIGITEEQPYKKNVIISLTTYGSRIYTVPLVIESLMEQTVKANKIILWLDNSLKNQTLPLSIYHLQERGLSVLFCNDIKSYKKLIPTLKLYPDDIIITVDDDVLYDYDMVEKLLLGYINFPNNIICNRMHKMEFNQSGELLPYDKWIFECTEINNPSIFNFATGEGGILYPPNIFTEEIFNEKVFQSICPLADDIWFKAMSLIRDTHVTKVYTHKKAGNDYILIKEGQGTALSLQNNGNKMNDVQLKAVFHKYRLYDKLKSYMK